MITLARYYKSINKRLETTGMYMPSFEQSGRSFGITIKRKGVEKIIKRLKDRGIVRRVGLAKGGHREVKI